MAAPTDPAVRALLDHMRRAGADGLKLPPPVFVDMEAEVVAADPKGGTLRVRFPVRERYQNPMGLMQGGMIAAAVDNVLGPLSYLVAPPSVTQQLTLTYVAPVGADVPYVEIEGRLVERAGRTLVLDARVENPEGAVLALARATCQIVRRAPADALDVQPDTQS